MPFRKSWHQRRRHSSFCSSVTEIPVAENGGGAVAGSGISMVEGAVKAIYIDDSNTNKVTKNGAAAAGGSGASILAAANRRCSEQPPQQQQHFVVMDIINEDNVEV